MKKAFTLIEMLVVIGIIGILAAVLLGTFSGGTESARAARCLTNLKNLASASQTYGMATGFYPAAGSWEVIGIDTSRGLKNARESYSEKQGWISWNSAGAYSSAPQSHVASASWFLSTYNEDDRAREYCYTNGALWKYVSGNRNVYMCPQHVRKYPRTPPAWSYVMNSYFGYDSSNGSKARMNNAGVEYGSIARPDRLLMFAELPYMGYETTPRTSTGPGFECDCTLQYGDNEMIGFNHGHGKLKVAHVVFADGHTEKLALPQNGLSERDIQELTEMLCRGKDVTFNGKRYEELK